MTRIFLPPGDLIPDEIVIHGETARYLSTVLRMRPEDALEILDGRGSRYLCRVRRIRRKEVLVEKIRRDRYSSESPLTLTLAQGIPKGTRMDFIIQKATELGVSRILPLITERSQVRQTDRLERWRKIARSASEQSGRERIPEIDSPLQFNEFLRHRADVSGSSPPGSIKGVILFEGKKDRNLHRVLEDCRNSSSIILLVGPEGGFSGSEVTGAIQKGFMETSVGPRILRTETAPLTALSIIQYELGDIG